MRRALALILCVASCSAQPVFAQSCERAVDLPVGTTATCSGVLWPYRASRAAAACLRLGGMECAQALEAQADVARVNLQAANDRADAWRAQAASVAAELAKAQARPSAAVLLGAGFLLGLAAAGAVAIATR